MNTLALIGPLRLAHSSRSWTFHLTQHKKSCEAAAFGRTKQHSRLRACARVGLLKSLERTVSLLAD